jgi:hypothetical protein
LSSSIPQNGIAALINASHNKPPPTESTNSIFGEDGFTFGDVIDIVNPLQHIPIISSIYRKVTGDTIAPAMEIAGGALFGGPLGAAISVVTTAFQSYTQDKAESTDPDSPYMENESTAIALNDSAKPSLKTISNNDYSLTSDTDINQSSIQPNTNKPELTHDSWVLSSQSISSNTKIPVNINTLQTKQTYIPADGIVNLAYKKTESLTDVISSTKSSENTIDIIIGSTADAGYQL